MEDWKKEFLDYVMGNYEKINSKGICSTCKHFDGKTCLKGLSLGGFATKLSDCNDKWEAKENG